MLCAAPSAVPSRSVPDTGLPPRAVLEELAWTVATFQPGHPSACGLPAVPPPADADTMVRVFFACQPPQGPGISAVPVRQVPVPPGEDPKDTALRALLAGEAPEEAQAGVGSSFGPASQNVPFDIDVLDGGLAVVNFDPAIMDVYKQGRHIFVSNAEVDQIVLGLGQFPDVKRVAILVGGQHLCKVIKLC